jgi:photosystem II stability/assembly factor-like uncharacterized protein
MISKFKVVAAALIATWTLCESVAGYTQSMGHFVDPLDVQAVDVKGALHADRQPLLALALAGKRVVAVGLRGLIIVSDDQGRNWVQASVPVQSDLTTVSFVSASRGWAAGHDGVILETLDGGLHWTKQLDLRQAREQFPLHYQNSAERTAASNEQYLAQVQNNFQDDSSLPYLGLAFADDKQGYAVGAFGMIASTVDGGKQWLPAFDRIDNPDQLNLNSIRNVGGHLYIAAERGVVFRQESVTGQFVRVNTGYPGSYFDIVGNDQVVLAFGLKGTAYRSLDQGKTWEQVNTQTSSALFSGLFLADGSVLLVDEAGGLLRANKQGQHFERLSHALKKPVASALIAGNDTLVVVGYAGVGTFRLPSSQSSGDQ